MGAVIALLRCTLSPGICVAKSPSLWAISPIAAASRPGSRIGGFFRPFICGYYHPLRLASATSVESGNQMRGSGNEPEARNSPGVIPVARRKAKQKPDEELKPNE